VHTLTGNDSRLVLLFVTIIILVTHLACMGKEPSDLRTLGMLNTPIVSPEMTSNIIVEDQNAIIISSPVTGPNHTSTSAPLTKMSVERVFEAFDPPAIVDIAHNYGDGDSIFLVSQDGRLIRLDREGHGDSHEIFLDISDRVSARGMEEGLLNLEFDPDYASTGYFYVFYTAAFPRRSVISRFYGGAGDKKADPDSEVVILEVRQPFANHNGGSMAFGPDGYLYIGLGDGGSGGDPQGQGQDTSTLLGTILRIDVRSVRPGSSYLVPEDNPFVGDDSGAREEIWAYGLRNPWRLSFDRETGVLWVGDVGQNLYEEVDIIEPGLNYGWNHMEGFRCFSLADCDSSSLQLPVIEYSHDHGCSVTGGYVYRGRRLHALQGAYVYGDFCSGKIWALRYDGERVTDHLEIVDSGLQIAAFGEDTDGELYILAYQGGIYRLVSQDALNP